MKCRRVQVRLFVAFFLLFLPLFWFASKIWFVDFPSELEAGNEPNQDSQNEPEKSDLRSGEDGGRGGKLAAQTIKYYDRHGLLLREVRPVGGMRRSWASFDEVSPLLVAMLIDTEDRRFMHHFGVDPVAILRAIFSDIKEWKMVSGASTITMQLARQLRPHPRTFMGKLTEMAMAIKIEWKLGKKQILEHYLNRAPFGPNMQGIAASSSFFFDKPPLFLSAAEAASLVAMLKSPTFYHLERRKEAALARRNRIIEHAFKSGILSREQMTAAWHDPLALKRRGAEFGAPHFIESLKKNAWGESIKRELLAQNEVRTSLDAGLQIELSKLAERAVQGMESEHISSAAMVVLDNATREVLAYVGSADYFDTPHLGQNDGVQAQRQPGSTLKPFLYELSMERLGYTPATLLLDVPTHFETEQGETFAPRNYDKKFHGPVRLREALGNSYNVPAARVAKSLGVPVLLERLRELGLTTLSNPPEFYGEALALGDGEVKLIDLANAYATLAQDGLYKPATPLLAFEPGVGKQVMQPLESRLMTDILADASARLSSFGEHTVLDFPFPVAAKTGTSKGFRDNLVVGYTKEITLAVWVGNFDGSPMRGTTGISGAGPLFHEAMFAASRAYKGINVRSSDLRQLERSNELRVSNSPEFEHREICALSGDAPTPYCSHRVQESFILKPHFLHVSDPPLKSCRMHISAWVDPENGQLASETCKNRERRVFEYYEGELNTWAKKTFRVILPESESPRCPGGKRELLSQFRWWSTPHSEDPQTKDEAEGAGLNVEIVYPRDQMTFVIDPSLEPGSQYVPIEIRKKKEVSHLESTYLSSASYIFFLDGKKIEREKNQKPNKDLGFSLEGLKKGEHTLSVKDEMKDGKDSHVSSVQFYVK